MICTIIHWLHVGIARSLCSRVAFQRQSGYFLLSSYCLRVATISRRHRWSEVVKIGITQIYKMLKQWPYDRQKLVVIPLLKMPSQMAWGLHVKSQVKIFSLSWLCSFRGKCDVCITNDNMCLQQSSRLFKNIQLNLLLDTEKLKALLWLPNILTLERKACSICFVNSSSIINTAETSEKK